MTFNLTDFGTIVIITPMDDEARAFSEDKFPDDSPRWADGYAVETNYVGAIVADIEENGGTFETR